MAGGVCTVFDSWHEHIRDDSEQYTLPKVYRAEALPEEPIGIMIVTGHAGQTGACPKHGAA
jgi:hypothetical protein